MCIHLMSIPNKGFRVHVGVGPTAQEMVPNGRSSFRTYMDRHVDLQLRAYASFPRAFCGRSKGCDLG